MRKRRKVRAGCANRRGRGGILALNPDPGCIFHDTACVEVCPVDCIHGPVEAEQLRALDPEERKRAVVTLQLFIDPADCIYCGACVPECPVDAIYAEVDVPSSMQGDIAANELFFKKLRGAH